MFILVPFVFGLTCGHIGSSGVAFRARHVRPARAAQGAPGRQSPGTVHRKTGAPVARIEFLKPSVQTLREACLCILTPAMAGTFRNVPKKWRGRPPARGGSCGAPLLPTRQFRFRRPRGGSCRVRRTARPRRWQQRPRCRRRRRWPRWPPKTSKPATAQARRTARRTRRRDAPSGKKRLRALRTHPTMPCFFRALTPFGAFAPAQFFARPPLFGEAIGGPRPAVLPTGPQQDPPPLPSHAPRLIRCGHSLSFFLSQR